MVGRTCLTVAVALMLGVSTSCASSNSRSVLFTDHDAKVSIRHPASWNVLDKFSVQTIPSRMALASFPVADFSSEGDCSAYKAIAQLPSAGAVIFILEYTNDDTSFKFEARPERFTLDKKLLAHRECYGQSYEIAFRAGGRLFQVYVALGSAVSTETRQQALDVLDSIQIM